MSERGEEHAETPETFKPVRGVVNIDVGSFVRTASGVYRIIHAMGFQTVIGQCVETKRTETLSISDLRPADENTIGSIGDLSEIGDEDWRTAARRFEIIRPLLSAGSSRSLVEERAKEMGLGPATIYRWISRYAANGDVSALIPAKRGGTRGQTILHADAEAVISEVVHDVYLTNQRAAPQKAVTEVLRRCHERKISPPSPNTIRTRLSRISPRESLRARGQREKARNRFVPAPGHFPNADYPLAVVQIDHTPVDIILVDEQHRRPIGRPWLTLAIDVYSRMITGYYLSFDPPSFTSVGMCIVHSILPKEDWLLLHGVEGEWPVWSKPHTIHTDNGADFRGDNLRDVCLLYGINREFRPIARPNFGGHIERLIGTLMREVHKLPGTTFSSVAHKGEYNSEKHASMTLREFEVWLVTLITNVYHKKIHSKIGISPIRKWTNGIYGDGKTEGIGSLPRPADPHTVLLDFLPSFSRTVQAFGVTIDGIGYYADCLRHWINETEPDDPTTKRKLIFRRDPRDISAIWFFDPDLKQYFKIPYADQRRPPMSVWELEQVKAQLKREGAKEASQEQIFATLASMRAHVEATQATTKKSRRAAERRIHHERKVTPAHPGGPPQPPPLPKPPAVVAGWDDDDSHFPFETA